MKRANPAFRDRFNLVALGAVVLLVAVSLLVQANAQFYAGGDFYQRQTIWVVVGGALFVGAAVFDLRLVERSAYAFYAIVFALLVLTLFIGTSPTGEFKRWIKLGAFNIQASEFAKLAVVLAFARYLHQRKERMPGEDPRQAGSYDITDLGAPALMVFAPLILILKQPDLGTSLMLLFVAGTMLAMEGIRRRAVVIVAVLLAVAVPVAWKSGVIQDYQKDRVYKLVDQDWEKVDDKTGAIVETRTTQVEQAIWAIGTGGFTGAGHRGGSKARLGKLPEVHTDFIVPMVAEEHGLVGMTVLLFLFWVLVVWSLRTAYDSRSRFSRLVAIGIAALLAWQVFINIGMVTGILPVVGLPLPFLSYGGSSMMMLMLSLGILFNIAIKRGRM
ncbi:MAG: rod shape-determining protein RodA [Deltaproteobacteria bacterium]|nr:MAG: rod shape-determining protein RodA [Deltaproteobacteria bacterium]